MRASRRNNLIAGTFLLACLVLAVGVSVVLSDLGARLTPKHEYVVRFDLTDGASGIIPGSKVLIGGRETGRVTRVGFAYEDPDRAGAPTGVDVAFVMPQRIVLYENATATLASPLIGTMSAINIIDLGDPGYRPYQGAGARLEPGEILDGRLAPPSFLAQAGFGPDQADTIRRVIDRFADMVDRLDRMVVDVDERLGPILDDGRRVVEDIGAVVGDVREREPGWADQVDTSLARITDAADQADKAMRELRTGVESATELIADAREAVGENRPKIDRIVDNVESASAKIDAESVDLLNRSLEGIDESSTEFAELGRRANEILAEQAPDIRRVLANTRLASDQLKLAMVEIRRNPWRLLYRPSAKETRTEILYDAARAYAAAVSDLRAASESLEVATARSEPDPGGVQRLLARLQEAFERFETTERRLFEQLLEE